MTIDPTNFTCRHGRTCLLRLDHWKMAALLRLLMWQWYASKKQPRSATAQKWHFRSIDHRLWEQYYPRIFHQASTSCLQTPEALSLLSTVTKCATFDYTAPNSIADFRKLVIEIMSWNASHSVSATPDENYEDQWDKLQMNACYHIRSAMISANAPVMWACINAHNDSWAFDVQQGIDIHAESCRHLKTRELFGTRYHDVAIWAKMTLNSHATPTQSGDEHMSELMKHSGIESWEQMKALLKRFVYRKELAGGKYWRLFNAL